MNELYELIKCPINHEIPTDPVRMEQLRGGTGHGGNADADLRNQIWSMHVLQHHYDLHRAERFRHPLTRELLVFNFTIASKQVTMISLAIRYNIQMRRARGLPVDGDMQDIETDIDNYFNSRSEFERTAGEEFLAEFIRNPAGPIVRIEEISAETCAVISRKYNPQTLQMGIIPLPRCIEQEILKVRAEENRVAESNRYADQVATLGRDRHTAFYAYYNADSPQIRQNLTNALATDMATAAAVAAEAARVTAANQYADQAVTLPGRDRTTAFYAHYNAKSEEERQVLLNKIQLAKIHADAAAQAERERVNASNQYADQMLLTGHNRTVAFYAYYNRQTEQQRVATANQYAEQVVAVMPRHDRTTAFYTYYNAGSAQERKMLEDALSVSVATAKMEAECVVAANQQADVEAQNGADRTTSFFTHYASLKERERVKSANLYADYAHSLGQDRTGSFYAHYNAKSAEERQALEDQVSTPRRNLINAF